MRKREAYGILLIVAGLAALGWMKIPGLIALTIGLGLIAYGFSKPRVSL